MDPRFRGDNGYAWPTAEKVQQSDGTHSRPPVQPHTTKSTTFSISAAATQVSGGINM